jgi:pimeloyl-ACP methyl ester carboxylesterase
MSRAIAKLVMANSELAPDRSDVLLGMSKAGFHELAYYDWGPLQAERPVLCVHGLTRQGRDFDYLAASLAAAGRRIICPDVVGRGQSGRLADPDDYGLPQYCADMNLLIARLGSKEIDWIGTSLGGLIGMVMAGFPGSPIRRLVINDIGPFVSWTGLLRIGRYIAEMPTSFETFEAAEQYFREILAPYGDLSDEHWRHLTRHSVLWDASQGRHAVLCDPLITRAFGMPWSYSLDLWKYWERIEVPILVLHGAKSDLLSSDLTREMSRRNPSVTVHQFADCGHAPPLMTADQIDVVTGFLLEGQERPARKSNK